MEKVTLLDIVQGLLIKHAPHSVVSLSHTPSCSPFAGVSPSGEARAQIPKLVTSVLDQLKIKTTELPTPKHFLQYFNCFFPYSGLSSFNPGVPLDIWAGRPYLKTGDTVACQPATGCLQDEQLIYQHKARQHFDSEVASNTKKVSLELNAVTGINWPSEDKQNTNCQIISTLAKAYITSPSARAGMETIT